MTTIAVLHGLLRDAIDVGDNASDKGVAHRVLSGLKVGGKALDVLLPLMEQEANRVRRGATRSLERGTDRHLTGASPADQILARQKLLDSAFPLGDGRWVSWGDATVSDHVDRITFLARQRDGLVATIGRHEDAISAIKEANVNCLREIEEAA